MRQRSIAWALAALFLLVAGCARPAPAPDPGKEPAAPPPDANKPPVTGEPPPASPSPLRRHRFEPSQPVGQPGIFFLNLATGAVEGWTVEGDAYAYYAYSASPDNRWVLASGQTVHYLADRQTGRVLTLPEAEQLMAAGGDRLLLGNPIQESAGETRLTDGQLKTVATFPFRPRAALFAPDGSTLLLAGFDGGLHRVESSTGRSAKLLDLPADQVGVTMELAPGGAEARLTLWLPNGKSRLLRVDWQGQLLADKLLEEGYNLSLSPDGQSIAWESSVAGGLVQTITVADFPSLTPRFRLAGAAATFCTGDLMRPYEAWLADSSGLITRAGLLNPTTGQVGPLTALPEGADPEPAPHRADLFALDRTRVMDGAGKLIAEAKLGPDPQWTSAGHHGPWGARGDEIRFTLPHLGHGGRCAYQPNLPLKLERPPFQAELVLVVGLPASDCVNLREGPGKASRPRTCLPGGTGLTAVTPPPVTGGEKVQEWPNGIFMDDDWWVYVRTEAGQEGWVAFGAGELTWAE